VVVLDVRVVRLDVVIEHLTDAFVQVDLTFSSPLVLQRCLSLRAVPHIEPSLSGIVVIDVQRVG
jgi:hypothetical protein